MARPPPDPPLRIRSPLIRADLVGPDRWRVALPFIWRLDALEDPWHVLVPEGFVTDFASIPRVLRVVWSPTGAYAPAALVHDWLYAHGAVTHDDGPVRLIDRGEADRIFREIMVVLEIGPFTRQSLYQGVRIGGWLAWRRHAPQRRQHALELGHVSE